MPIMRPSARTLLDLGSLSLAALTGCAPAGITPFQHGFDLRPASAPGPQSQLLGTWQGDQAPRAFLRFDRDGTFWTWTGDLRNMAGAVPFHWTDDRGVITATVRDPRQGVVTQKFAWTIGLDGRLTIDATEAEDGRTVRHTEQYSKVE